MGGHTCLAMGCNGLLCLHCYHMYAPPYPSMMWLQHHPLRRSLNAEVHHAMLTVPRCRVQYSTVQYSSPVQSTHSAFFRSDMCISSDSI